MSLPRTREPHQPANLLLTFHAVAQVNELGVEETVIHVGGGGSSVVHWKHHERVVCKSFVFVSSAVVLLAHMRSLF